MSSEIILKNSGQPVSQPVVAEQVSPPTQTVEPLSRLRVSPIATFIRVDSKDRENNTNATLGSALNYGASIEWSLLWTDKFRSHLGLEILNTKFDGTTEKSINNGHLLIGQINLGGSYQLLDRLRLGLSAAIGHSLFLRGTTLSVMTFDRVIIPKILIDADFLLFKKRTLSLMFSTRVGYSFPSKTSTYNVHSGYLYRGKIGFNHQLKSGPELQGGFYIQRQIQNTSITKQAVLDGGLELAATWSFE